jgi:hypothetical protein
LSEVWLLNFLRISSWDYIPLQGLNDSDKGRSGEVLVPD